MRIGLFSDIHFQPKGLDRIIATGDWIIEEFKRQRIDRVHCLGDVLNTREEVDVGSQSAALQFFQKLAEHFPVDVILGNHDMNLKHSRRVSSLDGLALHPNIRLHRETAIIKHPEVDGTAHVALMIPYHEDQSQVVKAIQHLQSNAPADVVSQIVGYGHLGINGAVKISRYNSRFTGAVGPDAFACLKRTFSGHFHVHQEMAHRMVYLGSPLQFNFGDAGDARGVVIYDTKADTWQHILNPHHDCFKFIAAADLGQVEANPELYRNTFITVLYDDVNTAATHEDVANRLRSIGVLDVKQESVVDRAIREHQVEVGAVKATSVVDLIEPFVSSVLQPDSQLDKNVTVAFAKGIIQHVNQQFQDVADTGKVFDAELDYIEIQNFMGVQQKLMLDFSAMPDGIWSLEGHVGAGKSTVLEALTWGLFGEVLRSDLKVDDVINDTVGRDCMVTIGFKNGYEIIRYRKAHLPIPTMDEGEIMCDGNGVKIRHDGHYLKDFEKGDPKATQAAIEELLGINQAAFTKSQILGQNVANNFLSAGEKDRREILESMLGLERFDAYLEEVRAMKKQLIQESEQQESIQQIKATELNRITSNISGIEQQIQKARDEHRSKLSTVGQRLHDTRGRLTAIQQAADAGTVELRQRAVDAGQTVQTARTHVDSFTDKLAIKATADDLHLQSTKMSDTILQPLHALRHQREQSLTRLSTESNMLINHGQGIKEKIQAYIPPDEANRAAVQAQVATLTQEVAFLEGMEAGGAEALAAADHAELQRLLKEIERLEELAKLGGGEHCPKCGQTLDAAAIATLLTSARTSMIMLTASHTSLLDKAAEARRIAASKRQEATTLKNSIPSDEQVNAASEMIHQLAVSLNEATRKIEYLANRALDVHADYDTRAQVLLANSGVSWEKPPQLDEAIGLITAEVARLRAAAEDAAKQFDHAAYQAAVQDVQIKTRELEAATQAVAAAMAAVEQAQRTCEFEINQLEGSLADLTKQDPTAPLLVLKSHQEVDWRRVQEEIEVSKRMSAAISQKQLYVAFWDRAFAAKGGMRAFLLEDSVAALNEVVGGYMQALSTTGLPLTFKSDLTVVERWGKRSGGQRKITDMAILLGMREVVAQRSRFKADFLFLDETFDSLDPDHRKKVQDLLAVVATRLRKVIVITHVSFAGVSLAGSLYAELTPAGTVITTRQV